MSLIAIELPPRDKPAAGAAEAGSARLPAEWSFAFSTDGNALAQQGRAALALLPRATRTVLVVPPQELAWHRLRCPKASGPKLRAALGGALEESLLDDDANLHLATWGEAAAGREVWVAVLERAGLQRSLAALDAAGLHADALVPALAPGLPGRGLAFVDAAGQPWAALADERGVRGLPLEGALARALVRERLTGEPLAAEGARSEPQAMAWSATAAAAAAAERWLGHPVPLVSEGEWLLGAALEARGNLLQFEFAPRQRGLRLLRAGVASWRAPRWRWLRWGVAGLVGLNLVGLNASAWQQRQAIVEREQAQIDLFKSSFPAVRSVLDPVLQMQAEADRARAASGRVGPGDFEALLGALAMAWPDGAAPLPAITYEPGRLVLAPGAVSEPVLAPLRDRLASGGLQLVAGDAPGSWQLRAAPGLAPKREAISPGAPRP